MTTNKPLSIIWLKSAVLGCLWASSEIVLGSFLHNFRVPFASNFLTGIGIILLISVSYLWKDKGLFWRSGLICALMKSVSPSAVIFGPMIAIFCESLLMELSVRIFRRNMFAYILGGMLAMSWTFFHKISSIIITYGLNLVELYKNLAVFAQKQLKISFVNIWEPIIALWFIYLFMGIVAALLGIYIGRKASKEPLVDQKISINRSKYFKPAASETKIKTSFLWLIYNLMVMVAVLVLINFTDWIWWCSAGIVVIVIWALRYNMALRPLKKPKFWILFILITMLTSFLFTKFQDDPNDIYNGLMIGLQMNFRAVILIIGFSVVGTELTNPLIRKFFSRPSFLQLAFTLEVAFDTLPFVIGNMPDFKSFFRRPVYVIMKIVTQAEIWLERVKLKQNSKNNIIIITGEKGQGKSALIEEIVSFLKRKKIKTGGIIAPSVNENNERIGYDLINAASGEREVLSRTYGNEDMVCAGKYYFHEQGIKFGDKALALENNQDSQIMVIDEIGFLELENLGWAQRFTRIINDYEKPIIINVRSFLVDKVKENWLIKEPLIIEAGKNDLKEVIKKIAEFTKLDIIKD